MDTTTLILLITCIILLMYVLWITFSHKKKDLLNNNISLNREAIVIFNNTYESISINMEHYNEGFVTVIPGAWYDAYRTTNPGKKPIVTINKPQLWNLYVNILGSATL